MKILGVCLAIAFATAAGSTAAARSTGQPFTGPSIKSAPSEAQFAAAGASKKGPSSGSQQSRKPARGRTN